MNKLFYFCNGRSSLYFAFKNLNLKKNDEILYPNFSCDVIFQYENIIKSSKKFYNIKENFFFDINSIKQKITKKTKVIVVINFFGISQSTKKLHNLCKRLNILLIIDDCHTFYDLKKNINNDCDLKFLSVAKVFKSIEYGGILQVNNKKFCISKKFPKIQNYSSYNFIIKKKIKSLKIYKKTKYLGKRPKYEDPYFFTSEYKIIDKHLNDKQINILNNLNVKKEIKKRYKNFIFWNKICKNLKIKPLLKLRNIQHGTPIFFPAICQNQSIASEIFNLGWKNSIEIISWPTLIKKQINNKKILNQWKKLIYFPMDNTYYKQKNLLKWKRI